ncbi:MAG TPA: penicillin-binding transpeptidase domain-containing protein, partial [Marmoricola sp.]|nr:penicillin-binding transpeptidase domain-containing protein [Marmoricola sp.]
PKTAPNGCATPKVVAAFYCDYVRRYLLADPALGDSVSDRLQLINNGGLTIKTTMNLSYQRAANAAAQATVAPTDSAVGALAMVQPGTGNVLALAQSRPMGTDAKKGQTFLNYLVDPKYGDSAGFQPGSSFKLFTLNAALTEGLPSSLGFYSPHTLNVPQNQFQTCGGAYPNTTDWNVSNSTTDGQMTMYTGMQQSVNTYFAQLERQTGICQPYKLAKSMGIDFGTSNPQVPSFTLGVASANPLELAEAYATMPARGKYCAPRPVAEILNSKGGVFKTYPTQCRQVVPQSVADRVNDILSGVMSPSGFGANLLLNRQAAAKTGTSESNQAVWFNGYTPTVSTSAVVAGLNSAGQPTSLNPIPLNGIYYGTAHGSTVAGPMWAKAMRAIENGLPNIGFVPPVDPPNQAGLPSVEGQSVAQATSILRAAGYAVARAGQVNSNYSPGTVAQVSLGADLHTVYLFTAADSPLYTAPPVNPNPPPTNGKPGKGNGNGNGKPGNGNGGGHGGGHH